MRFDCIIGLTILFIVAALSQISTADADDVEVETKLSDVSDQGHENTSGREARQFGFGYPPPPPPPSPFGPGFGGPGFGGPGFGGPGFGGPGFGGPGFGGGYGGGYGGGFGSAARFRVSERYRVRQRVRTSTGFGGAGVFIG